MLIISKEILGSDSVVWIVIAKCRKRKKCQGGPSEKGSGYKNLIYCYWGWEGSLWRLKEKSTRMMPLSPAFNIMIRNYDSMWWNFIECVTESLAYQQFQRSNAKSILYVHLLLYLKFLPFCFNFSPYGPLSSRGFAISYYLHASDKKGTPLPTPHIYIYRYHKRDMLQLKSSVLMECLPYLSFKIFLKHCLVFTGLLGFQMLLCLITTCGAQWNTGCWAPGPPTVTPQAWGRPGGHRS